MRNYRGWKLFYKAIAGEYVANKGSFTLTAKTRVEIEREIDKFEIEDNGGKKVDK